MLLSAASIAIASVAASAQLTPAEQVRWNRIAPSVAYLYDDRGPRAAAALIDSRGYFLAHRSAVNGNTELTARLQDGNTFKVRLGATDEATQLVLLVAVDWTGRAKPVTLPSRDEVRGEPLFAVLATGPMRAEFYRGDVLGVVNPSRRVLGLSEIRFEAPSQKVGGALVFTQSGQFLGALNATLEPQKDQNMISRALESVRSGAGTDPAQIVKKLKTQLGPGELTIAYTVGADALKRVVEGFRSPSRQVSHPSLGIYCLDSSGRGALVVRVDEGSPGALGGVRPNDLITEMAGVRIESNVDYARTLLRQEVGAKIQLTVVRGGLETYLWVTVGK